MIEPPGTPGPSAFQANQPKRTPISPPPVSRLWCHGQSVVPARGVREPAVQLEAGTAGREGTTQSKGYRPGEKQADKIHQPDLNGFKIGGSLILNTKETITGLTDSGFSWNPNETIRMEPSSCHSIKPLVSLLEFVQIQTQAKGHFMTQDIFWTTGRGELAESQNLATMLHP